jgi:hypothetical protein
MAYPRIALVTLTSLLILTSGTARADYLNDVVAAQANARAGGPVSDHDRELLARWGCESGTRYEFCQQIRHGATTVYRAYRSRPRNQ